MMTSGRRKLVAAGLASLAAAGLVAAAIIAGEVRTADLDPAPAESPTPEVALSDLPLAAAEDGGELRIAESGLSPTKWYDGDEVSWGLIVENTSDVTAAAVQVSLDILDDDGTSLVESDRPQEREISLIMPGQRAGIGDSTRVTGPGVSDITFELHDPKWWPVENQLFPVAKLTASDLELFREEGNPLSPGGEPPLVVQFRLDSEYELILDDPSAQAIFRDKDGTIVGGTHPGDTDLWATFPPGWSIQRIRVASGLPEHADLARTEIYPYPGCC